MNETTNTAKTIRWGFLGCGSVAYDVAADFKYVPDAKIAAVSSRTKKSRKKFAKKFKVFKKYETLEAMLADKELDVIYIATPHHLHQQHAMQCLQAGKAVVCEKPFTISAAEARPVIATAREKKLFCMEAMWMRFFPLIQATKQLIDNNELGDIHLMQAEFGYPTAYDPDSRFFNAEMAGGALLDRGIYPISLAQYLLGAPNKVSSTAFIGQTGVDEFSSCLLQFESGAIANLSSTLTSLATNEAIINGSKGKLKIHDPFYRPKKTTTEKYSPPNIQPTHTTLKQRLKNNALVRISKKAIAPLKKIRSNKTQIKGFPGNGYQFEIQEATRCLQQGLSESPIMPLDDTLQVLKIMDVMRHQWKKNDSKK